MVMNIVRTVLVALAVSFPATAQEAPRFASVIDDLPLMSGLNETGEGVAFATPQGRLAEITATGAVSRKAVLAFYAKTLPQLGWTPAGDARFEREGESLGLVMTQTGGVLSVRFSLAPAEK